MIKDLKKRNTSQNKLKTKIVDGKIVHKLLHVIKEREEPQTVKKSKELDEIRSENESSDEGVGDGLASPIIGK